MKDLPGYSKLMKNQSNVLKSVMQSDNKIVNSLEDWQRSRGETMMKERDENDMDVKNCDENVTEEKGIKETAESEKSMVDFPKEESVWERNLVVSKKRLKDIDLYHFTWAFRLFLHIAHLIASFPPPSREPDEQDCAFSSDDETDDQLDYTRATGGLGQPGHNQQDITHNASGSSDHHHSGSTTGNAHSCDGTTTNGSGHGSSGGGDKRDNGKDDNTPEDKENEDDGKEDDETDDNVKCEDEEGGEEDEEGGETRVSVTAGLRQKHANDSIRSSISSMDPDSEFGKSPKKLQIQSNVGPRKNITNLDMQVNYVSVKEDKNSRIEALIPAQQKRKSLADRQKCETLVPIVDHSLASLNIDEKSMTPSLAEEIQEEGRYMAKSQPFLKEHEASNPRTSASDGDIHTNSEGKDDCQLDLNGPDVPGNVQVITTPRTLHCDTISSESLSQQTARSSFDIPLVSLNQGKGVEITAEDHTEALVLPREGFNSSQPDSFYTGKLFLKRQALNSPDVLSSAEDSYGGAKPKTKNAISSGQPGTTLYDDQNSMRAVPVSGVLPSGSNVVYSRNAYVMYGSVLDVRTFAQSIPCEGHLQLECIGVLMEDEKGRLRIIFGQYRLSVEWIEENYIGHGGQGSCFMAVDQTTRTKFAVKRIKRHTFRPSEVMILAKVGHLSGVVKLYGIVASDDYVYILMEFLEGPTLREWIDHRLSIKQPLSSYEALVVIHQVLGILGRLKQASVLHDDIKAENIVFQARPEHGEGCSLELKLVDFGMAYEDPPKRETEGTFTHFSPEKARSDGHSYSSEVFAALITFMHMILGYVPKQDYDKWPLLFDRGCDNVPTNELPQSVPDDITNFVKAGLVANPDLRYKTEELLSHPALLLLSTHSPDDQMFYSHLEAEESPGSRSSQGQNDLIVPRFDMICEDSEEESEGDECTSNPDSGPGAMDTAALGHVAMDTGTDHAHVENTNDQRLVGEYENRETPCNRENTDFIPRSLLQTHESEIPFSWIQHLDSTGT